MDKYARGRSEVRKIQLTGGSTYLISLPKKWVQNVGLEKGSQLNLLIQDDGTLLLVPKGIERREKQTEAFIKAKYNEDPDLLIRKVISAYLVGYNVIYIRPENRRLELTQRNSIKDFTRKMLVGTEILADSPSEIIMKVLLSYPDLSIQSALRRMCIIASSMHKDAMKALKELNRDLAHEVISMDDEVDRFNLYIIRQLKAAVEDESIIRDIGLTTRRDCLGYRLITKSVERTADHAVEIAENTLSLKEPIETELYEKIESMSRSAVSIFNESIESLFKEKFDAANRIVQKAKMVALQKQDLIRSIIKRSQFSEVSSLSLIIESVTRTVQYASDIAEIVLNLNINHILSEG